MKRKRKRERIVDDERTEKEKTLKHRFMEEQYLGLAKLDSYCRLVTNSCMQAYNFCYIFCLLNESSVYKYVKMNENECLGNHLNHCPLTCE